MSVPFDSHLDLSPQGTTTKRRYGPNPWPRPLNHGVRRRVGFGRDSWWSDKVVREEQRPAYNDQAGGPEDPRTLGAERPAARQRQMSRLS
jgi:hypothetical protein